MDAWTYDKIDEAVQILADIADSLKRLADFYTPIPSKDEPNSSKKPNNCKDETETDWKDQMWKEACREEADRLLETQIEDESQTETETVRETIHKMIDNTDLAEDAYPGLRQRLHDAVDEYEPQTIRCPKCGRSDYIREFGKDFSVTAKEAGFKYKCINCNTYIEPQTERSE